MDLASVLGLAVIAAIVLRLATWLMQVARYERRRGRPSPAGHGVHAAIAAQPLRRVDRRQSRARGRDADADAAADVVEALPVNWSGLLDGPCETSYSSSSSTDSSCPSTSGAESSCADGGGFSSSD